MNAIQCPVCYDSIRGHREVAVDDLELSTGSIEEANLLTEREDGPGS